MILASFFTTALSSPWMAALGAALLAGKLTEDSKNDGGRFLILIIAAIIGAAVVYPIHKSIKDEHTRKMSEPLPSIPGESLLDYNRRLQERR